MSLDLATPGPRWPLPVWILARAFPMALRLWPLVLIRIGLRFLGVACITAAVLPLMSPWPVPGAAVSLALVYLGMRWLCWGRAGMLALLREASWHPDATTTPRFRWRTFRELARPLVPRVMGINALILVTLLNWSCVAGGAGMVLVMTDALGTGPLSSEVAARKAAVAAGLGLLLATPFWILLRAAEALAVERRLPTVAAIAEALSLARRRPLLFLFLALAAALAAGFVSGSLQLARFVMERLQASLSGGTETAIVAGFLGLALTSVPLEQLGAIVSAAVWMGLARCTHPAWPGDPPTDQDAASTVST